MRKILPLLIALTLFSSHDLYLKLDTYFLSPNTPAQLRLFNGTFDNSENTIARNRMIDVSLVGNGERLQVDTAQWSDDGNQTILKFKTGAAGTWVAGVSTRARNIELAADDFNDYLMHDGVVDMLDDRQKNNTLDQDAVEKYSKHVKTIFQVGDAFSDDWQTVLGYPIEFVPLQNPYELHPGHELSFQLLWQGKPLANQVVFIGSKETEHPHDHSHEHAHDHGDDQHQHQLPSVSTDADGKMTFKVSHSGIWYLRTIYMTHSTEPGLTHESNWATLTFEVGHGHSHAGIPWYVYGVGALIVMGGGLLIFRG